MIAQRFAGFSKLLVGVVVLLLVAAGVLFLNNGDGKRYLTVDFQQTNSLYKGSDVRILGVPVGRVESLTPRGDVVRVKIAYDGKQKLPADVKAVVVSPSIVGDRYVQLAPAYTGGPALRDKAFLPVDRTAVPIELDAIYQSLDDLSVALGPKGANKEGSLSTLLDSTAEQLNGQGAQVNETIRNFGKLSTTLSNNKDELFGSLREVEDFVSLLRTNDSSVRAFNDSTARVSEVLAGERDDLAATLEALSKALVDVNSLVKENRSALRGNVDNIASLAQLLAKHKEDLEAITVNAPTALTNVALAYNGNSGTLDTRADLPEIVFSALDNPASLVCNLLGETLDDKGLCSALTGVLDKLKPKPKPKPEDAALPRTSVAPQPPAASTFDDPVYDSLADVLGGGR
ncbi:MCE family protein [Aeromicrobium chenweiae]|uniref:Virulence factor Mce n=1 Tax=Aeromicrobium chenweiae TaxID=2079793 RepID=A0A2S0WQ34_9ACTN|nr:MlaD family protein [Aeromicrobium chenweiae]AWB93421.1 virulence factor Mce [Aeromicrobium chenweiae]TGN34413.1 MCE family protein [Aeromicrobium chenweiae]